MRKPLAGGAGGDEDEGAEQVRAQCGDDDLRREFGAALDLDDRHDGEHDVEQGDKKADRRRDPQPEGCAHGQSAQPADRDGEQGEVGNAVEDPGGVVDELESLLRADPELTHNGEDKGNDSDEQDGVDRGLVTAVQAAEPPGQKVVPAGNHRQPGVAGKVDADKGDGTPNEHKDGDGGDERAGAEGARASAQGLGHGTDEVKVGKTGIGHDRARAEDEHESDNGRGDDDGAPDVFDWRARFAGQNGDVLETAQGAERHFAKDVEAEEGDGRERPDDRVVDGEFARGAGDEGQGDERAVSDKKKNGADVVDPFTDA